MMAARGITYDVITTARVAPLSIDWLGQSGPHIVVFSRSCISLWKIANGRDSTMETVKKNPVFYASLTITFTLTKLVYKIDCLTIPFLFNDIHDHFHILILNEMKIRPALLVCLLF